MNRLLRHLWPAAVISTAVAAVVACDNEDPIACTADSDCGQGLFCRQAICVSLGGDAGTGDAGLVTFDAASCSNDGVVCTQPIECCSGQCTQNRCGLVPGGGTPSCKNQNETCLLNEECCVGRLCQNNLCR